MEKVWESYNLRVSSTHPNYETFKASDPLCPLPDEEELFEDMATMNLPWEQDISTELIETFRRQRWIRLQNVIPRGILSAVRERIMKIGFKLSTENNIIFPSYCFPACMASRDSVNPAADIESVRQYWKKVVSSPNTSWNTQMMWTIDPVVRELVCSPRIGDIVCKLLGCENIQLYHDNFLYRVPGSKRTRWHCDDGPQGYMAMSERNAVTVWYPLQKTSPEKGSLVFASLPGCASDHTTAEKELVSMGEAVNAWHVAAIENCPLQEQSDEYDSFVASALCKSNCQPDEATYELGDISIHYTDCFHSAGPNLTDSTRMIIAVTYFAEGSTMRVGGVSKFCPGVQPGQVIVSKLNPVIKHCEI